MEKAPAQTSMLLTWALQPIPQPQSSQGFRNQGPAVPPV
jgi:hypothetical protein